MSHRYIIHTAAAVENNRQACSRCGEVLIDGDEPLVSGAALRTAHDHDLDGPPTAWPEGARVGMSVRDRGLQYVCQGELDEEESECGGGIDATTKEA